jgi:hypothetical protein
MDGSLKKTSGKLGVKMARLQKSLKKNCRNDLK